MGRLFIALLSAALALPACATGDRQKTRAEAAKVDKEKEQAAKKRSEQAKSQGGASSGQSAPPAGSTDLGAEAEREEARIRAGGSATSQSR
jgi:uncharacterized cupredoxin-like copper-binding protein